MSVFVIAELGSCHDMSLEKAGALIRAAKRAGADAAKFQYWSSAERMARRRNAADYIDVYRRYMVTEAWLETLKLCCDANGIEFMCSTYLPEDVEVVAPFVGKFKVASFEANDRAHLVAHADHLARGKQVIVSMGLGAVRGVVFRWLAGGDDGVARGIRLLHCVSAYPVDVDHLHLELIMGYNSTYGECRFHGFSDHSKPNQQLTGGLAVAAGATIIERHVRLDDTDPQNPDAPHAMTPSMFGGYVSGIRFAERAMRPPDGVTDVEGPMRAYRVREDGQ